MKMSYTKDDVNLAGAFLKPVVQTYQLSEEAFKGMIDTLKLVLDKKTEPTETWLTVKETCKKLKISKPTLYTLINSKKLEIIKIGRSTRILESEVSKVFGGAK
jgi:excisionase family DNA binding protein